MNDTNLISLLIELARNHGGAVSLTSPEFPWTGLGTMLGVLIVGFMQQVHANQRKKQADDTAQVVEKVHIAVNSGATAAADKAKADRETWDKKLADMMQEINRLATDLATSHERERGSEVARALSAVPVVAPVAVPALFTAEQLQQLKAALAKS